MVVWYIIYRIEQIFVLSLSCILIIRTNFFKNIFPFFFFSFYRYLVYLHIVYFVIYRDRSKDVTLKFFITSLEIQDFLNGINNKNARLTINIFVTGKIFFDIAHGYYSILDSSLRRHVRLKTYLFRTVWMSLCFFHAFKTKWISASYSYSFFFTIIIFYNKLYSKKENVLTWKYSLCYQIFNLKNHPEFSLLEWFINNYILY